MDNDLEELVKGVEWYHTIDLGNGILTPGDYDHRPFLDRYHLPENLAGKTVLDIGAASGFFSFEFERRGARVTATELPAWFEHDFSPVYVPDKTPATGKAYLTEPFEIASKALHSHVERKRINIYDISPDSLGIFDLIFCGSVLLHLTDPVKALWKIASVTREKAILATVIEPNQPDRPSASFYGAQRGDVWWLPTRACLELMAVSAGFIGIEWIGEFRLDYRNGNPGPYHGVLHAYKTTQGWTENTLPAESILHKYQNQPAAEDHRELELQQLRELLGRYQQRKIIRFERWLRALFLNR